MSTAVSTKVLIVVTSHAQLGNTGKSTGYYLPEVTHPYAVLAEKGIGIDIASPSGGKAPLDVSSLNLNDAVNKAFWENPAQKAQLEQTLPLAEVDSRKYRAVLFAGGHGTMWDFADDPHVKRIIREVYESGGVVAAVCHGPAALVNATLSGGAYLVAGKSVAAFSDAEEEAVGLTKVMPFLLESALVRRGAKYSKAPLWQEHVVVDGRLVTGQNPASAGGVGRAVADLLRSQPAG